MEESIDVEAGAPGFAPGTERGSQEAVRRFGQVRNEAGLRSAPVAQGGLVTMSPPPAIQVTVEEVKGVKEPVTPSMITLVRIRITRGLGRVQPEIRVIQTEIAGDVVIQRAELTVLGPIRVAGLTIRQPFVTPVRLTGSETGPSGREPPQTPVITSGAPDKVI